MMKHAPFVGEAITESVPQSLIQLVALIGQWSVVIGGWWLRSKVSRVVEIYTGSMMKVAAVYSLHHRPLTTDH